MDRVHRGRAWRRHQRERRITWWVRFRRAFITQNAEPFLELTSSGEAVDDSWWFQLGRFAKRSSLRCGCRHCYWSSAEGKFRWKKAERYRGMDRTEQDAW